MTAAQQTAALMGAIERRTGRVVPFEAVNTLRRAQMTLHRWAELECGNNWGCVGRDEETGKTYWFSSGSNKRYPTPDRETGALKRVAKVCAQYGLHFYHQTDPRGCALYVAAEPLTDSSYTNGVAVTL